MQVCTEKPRKMKKANKHHIVLEIQGGLGNQLFQISALKYACRRLDRIPIIDLSRLGASSARRNFGISNNELAKIFDGKVPTLIKRAENRYLSRIKFSLKKKTRWFQSRTFFQKFTGYEDISQGRFNRMFGYFQSYIYAREIDWESVFENFSTENSDFTRIENEMKNNEITAVHIRGSDYLMDKSGIGNLSLDYFFEARALNKQGKLWVFTDDINHAKKLLRRVGEDPYFVGEYYDLSPIETLIALSKAKTIIISNSTFAWWGAYLSRNSNVICPKKWFQHLPDPLFLLPEEWNRIEPTWLVD
jgi:Glycosyl transferase family 11